MSTYLPFLLIIAFLLCHSECKANKCQADTSSSPLIRDITRESLFQVGKYFNATYLDINRGKPKTNYKLAIWGAGLRVMTYLPVRLSFPGCKTNINVVFIVDTGSPYTSLTDEAFIALCKACPQFEHIPNEAYYVRILSHILFTVSSKYSYMNINILGSDFLRMADAKLVVQYETLDAGYGSLRLTPMKANNRLKF